ncbi:MAG: IclR family transcriptional regulator C-terminal domain-containing protein, partial [Ilumatobacteraceae bacterium]
GVTTPKVLTFTMSVGTRSPLRSTSMGDVLLADLSDDELRRTLSLPTRSTMNARTSRTDEEFSVILPQVRRQGYAISDERLSFGIRVISVPIVDGHGRTAATLNTPALIAEVSVDELRDDFLPLLKVYAAKISVDYVKFSELPTSIVDHVDNLRSLTTQSP